MSNSNYKYILNESDEYICKIIETYKTKNVFKKYSKIKDAKIILTLILKHNLIEYKCCRKGCNVSNLWCNKPIKLHLVRNNNIDNDLRIENLSFYCLNCYSQMTDSNELFQKIKKKISMLVQNVNIV